MTISPPPRQRVQPVAKPKLNSDFDRKRIGGPKVGHVRGHFTEGKRIRQWPFIVGSECLGFYATEYRTANGDKTYQPEAGAKPVRVHLWRVEGHIASYVGTAATTKLAQTKLDTLSGNVVPAHVENNL